MVTSQPPPPRCPGGPQYRTANLAKRHAWWIERDSTKRLVPVQCGDHWHLKAPPPAP